MDENACLCPRELELLEEIRQVATRLPDAASKEIEEADRRLTAVMTHLFRALESCPGLQSSETIAGRTRNVNSLIESLARADSCGLDFLLPTRAVLGQSLLHAKINLFRAFQYILEGHGEAKDVRTTLDGVLGDALYFRLSEELLINCVTSTVNSFELKRAAAQRLIPLWQQRKSMPLDEDFTTLLLSAWRARVRVQEVFGTLVGFHEVVSLLHAECEPRFLEFFDHESVTTGESEALREFLFGVPHEDLVTLSKHMESTGKANVGPEDVARILGHSPYHAPATGWTPEDVYLSYRRRRVRADYRVITNRDGPRKTAEGYLMEYYILHESKSGRGQS